MTNTSKPRHRSYPVLGIAIFVALAAIGLYYVKWSPYYHRAFTAAATHSIGSSILMGTEPRAPAPSLDAALHYALAYGKAIWQAMEHGRASWREKGVKERR